MEKTNKDNKVIAMCAPFSLIRIIFIYFFYCIVFVADERKSKEAKKANRPLPLLRSLLSNIHRNISWEFGEQH